MTVRSPEERLATLETQVHEVKGDIGEIKSSVKDTQLDVRQLREEYGRRPSWAVTVVLTVLSSLVVGLAVALGSGATG
jgi:hypothetical protein